MNSTIYIHDLHGNYTWSSSPEIDLATMTEEDLPLSHSIGGAVDNALSVNERVEKIVLI